MNINDLLLTTLHSKTLDVLELNRLINTYNKQVKQNTDIDNLLKLAELLQDIHNHSIQVQQMYKKSTSLLSRLFRRPDPNLQALSDFGKNIKRAKEAVADQLCSQTLQDKDDSLIDEVFTPFTSPDQTFSDDKLEPEPEPRSQTILELDQAIKCQQIITNEASSKVKKKFVENTSTNKKSPQVSLIKIALKAYCSPLLNEINKKCEPQFTGNTLFFGFKENEQLAKYNKPRWPKFWFRQHNALHHYLTAHSATVIAKLAFLGRQQLAQSSMSSLEEQIKQVDTAINDLTQLLAEKRVKPPLLGWRKSEKENLRAIITTYETTFSTLRSSLLRQKVQVYALCVDETLEALNKAYPASLKELSQHSATFCRKLNVIEKLQQSIKKSSQTRLTNEWMDLYNKANEKHEAVIKNPTSCFHLNHMTTPHTFKAQLLLNIERLEHTKKYSKADILNKLLTTLNQYVLDIQAEANPPLLQLENTIKPLFKQHTHIERCTIERFLQIFSQWIAARSISTFSVEYQFIKHYAREQADVCLARENEAIDQALQSKSADFIKLALEQIKLYAALLTQKGYERYHDLMKKILNAFATAYRHTDPRLAALQKDKWLMSETTKLLQALPESSTKADLSAILERLPILFKVNEAGAIANKVIEAARTGQEIAFDPALANAIKLNLIPEPVRTTANMIINSAQVRANLWPTENNRAILAWLNEGTAVRQPLSKHEHPNLATDQAIIQPLKAQLSLLQKGYASQCFLKIMPTGWLVIQQIAMQRNDPNKQTIMQILNELIATNLTQLVDTALRRELLERIKIIYSIFTEPTAYNFSGFENTLDAADIYQLVYEQCSSHKAHQAGLIVEPSM